MTGPLAGQQAQPPAAASASTSATTRPSNLGGRWQFDDDESKEDQRNWRRPVGSARPIPTDPGAGGGFPNGGNGGIIPQQPPVGSGGGGGGYPGGGYGGGGGYLPRPTSSTFETEVRRALRDLLEIANGYDISVTPDQVTITDDLERTLTFATDGKKEKHRLGATSFETKTTWDGALLKQEIEAIGGLHMSQVFLPTEDGQAMFVSIRIDKPTFNPPIKPITRTYRRTN